MTKIQAIIFDLGGTLEDIRFDDALRLQATSGLREILVKHRLDPGLEIPDLYAVIKAGMKKYGQWREESELELPPERIWSEFVLPDQGLPRERVAAIGEELAFYYDMHFYARGVRPEAPTLLNTLHRRGFRLGVISNIYSRGAVPFNLSRYGLNHYFEVVVTSADFGCRKPNPRIFLEVTRRMGLPAAACAYVGDTISRDVVGARRAGYGLAIQIKSFLTAVSDKETDIEQPDAVIENLLQVIEVVTPALERLQ